MSSSAAADSGEGVRVAASTTDQRVLGKTRGASLEEAWLLMRASYQEQLSETRRLLQTLAENHNSAAYLQNWLEQLHNDKALIVQATAQAQAAADFILGTKFEEAIAG